MKGTRNHDGRNVRSSGVQDRGQKTLDVRNTLGGWSSFGSLGTFGLCWGLSRGGRIRSFAGQIERWNLGLNGSLASETHGGQPLKAKSRCSTRNLPKKNKPRSLTESIGKQKEGKNSQGTQLPSPARSWEKGQGGRDGTNLQSGWERINGGRKMENRGFPF